MLKQIVGAAVAVAGAAGLCVAIDPELREAAKDFVAEKSEAAKTVAATAKGYVDGLISKKVDEGFQPDPATSVTTDEVGVAEVSAEVPEDDTIPPISDTSEAAPVEE